MVNLEEALALLLGKDQNAAYRALQELQAESEASDRVYAYMDRFREMLDSPSAYIRVRGLTLLAANAKWDRDYKIDEALDEFLGHVTDPKPIAARQCVQLLPMVAQYKPELRPEICSALHRADLSRYKDSMRPLIARNIQKALEDIQAL